MDEWISFDPKEYLIALWKLLPALILSLIVGACGGLVYERTMAEHLYGATTKFYVISGDWATESRADDYVQIITSQPVARTVITREDLRDENGRYISLEAFLGMVEVSAYDETHIAAITVFNSDPYVACDAANALREVSMDAIEEIMNPGTIKVVQKANVPVNTAKPNAMLLCVIGAVVFFVLALAAVFVEMLIRKHKADKEKKIRRLPYFIVLSLLGIIFVTGLALRERNADRTGPDIIFPEGDITYAEGDDYDVLLKDVKAEDGVDGDCTGSIRIDAVYVSESGESCIVDYVVKDKSNNVTVAERYAAYKRSENAAADSTGTPGE